MNDLIKTLKSSPRLNDKTSLSDIWSYIPQVCNIEGSEVVLGDDAASIQIDGQYLLLAAEGVYTSLLKSNPYRAGRTSVLTNVNDIYSMGGRPVAVLDVLFSSDSEQVNQVLRGINDNASRYNVPVIGGHLSSESDGPTLAVFILGKAKSLLSSFNAREGDDLVLVTSSEGRFYEDFKFWDSSSKLSDRDAINQLEILSQLAESGLADSAKDVSMAGVIGSILMLLESSGKGAEIFIDDINPPSGITLQDWLLTFPSYGFVLSLRPENTELVQKKFRKFKFNFEKIGKVDLKDKVYFTDKKGNKELFWDLKKKPYIGIDKNTSMKVING